MCAVLYRDCESDDTLTRDFADKADAETFMDWLMRTGKAWYAIILIR